MQEIAKKILTLDELSAKAKEYRDSGKKVVLCHGAFDLLHAGHIRYLKSALSEGDILFVTVTADAFVNNCLLYTSPSPRDGLLSRMPSSA